jgi:hypothetical protein
LLPSEVLVRATTFDLMVTDVLATYETYESYKQAGQVMPQDDAYSVDELQAIMEKTRGTN